MRLGAAPGERGGWRWGGEGALLALVGDRMKGDWTGWDGMKKGVEKGESRVCRERQRHANLSKWPNNREREGSWLRV